MFTKTQLMIYFAIGAVLYAILAFIQYTKKNPFWMASIGMIVFNIVLLLCTAKKR